MKTEAFDIEFPGSPVSFARFHSCNNLVEPVREFLASWPISIVDADFPHNPLITIRKQSPGIYIIEAPWLPEPLEEHGLTCFLCSFGIEMTMAFCRVFSPMYLLHAAAASLPGGMCLFPADNHAGKSSLVVRLMAAGLPGLGDDLVALTPEKEVFSFGLPPRLRLPLAPSAALEKFIHENAGETDGRYQFLKNSATSAVSFGFRSQMDCCVFLERRYGGKAILRKISSSPARLLQHCVLSAGLAMAFLAFIRDLASGISFYELEYSHIDEACELLQSRSLDEKCETTYRADRGGARQPHCKRPTLSGRLCEKQKGVELISCEEGGYLVPEKDDAVFFLNKLGETIWRMMEYPLSEFEVANLLCEHFSDTPAIVIKNDIKRLFSELRQNGLILPCCRC